MSRARLISLALAAMILAGPALANAPPTSPRPKPRPVLIADGQSGASRSFEQTIQGLFRPRQRPVQVVQMTAMAGLKVSPRPVMRPQNLRRRTVVAASGMARAGNSARRLTRKGSVCGVKEIRGQALGAIPGKLRGCGVAQPVRVTQVSGIDLSQPVTVDCPTAKALNSWVRKGVIPAVGRLGGGAASLRVIAHYSCRTRNNKPGAKISEHGKGRAIDVAGVTLKNGVTLSVLKGWRDPAQKRVIRAMHKSACGPFGTVLGPNADRYHQDHIHVDTARYRSGSYCR